MEQKGKMKIGGQDVTILGEDVKVGQTAPEFTQQAQDWQPVDVLAATKGKVRVILALPSLSTSVCDRETRRFNEEAAALGDGVVVIAVSMDLPFTQKNWCAAAGIENVMVVSDHMEGDFGRKYGVLVKEQHLSWRQIGDSWLWDEVSAINLRNGRHTRLVQSNVKINSGLPDNLFTKRILKQGLNALRGRLGEARN